MNVAVQMTDEDGRDMVVTPFADEQAAHRWAAARSARTDPLPDLTYRVTAVVTPDEYDEG